MNTEIKILAISVFLGLVHIFSAAFTSTRQRGAAWNVGPRDGTPAPLTGTAGRLDRSLQNFKESYPLFVAAMAACLVRGVSTDMTHLGGYLYIVSRIAYIPLYLFGVSYVRSLVWLLSALGIMIVAGSALS